MAKPDEQKSKETKLSSEDGGIQRNPDGTFTKEGARVAGRKGGKNSHGTLSLVGMLRKELEKMPEGYNKKTWAELIIQRTLTQAVKGDNNMLKLAFQYIDGMPTQKIENEGAQELIIRHRIGNKKTND